MIRPTRQSTHRIALRQSRLAALLVVACLLLSLVVPTSCVEPLTPEQKLDYLSKELTIRIYMPGTVPGTKAENVSSVDPESRIYRLQVWMFNHYAAESTTGDEETAVAYSEVYFDAEHDRDLGNYDQSGYYDSWENIYEVRMVVPGYIMDRDADNMKFDFYVLANGNSISSAVNRSSTRGALKAATFGATYDLFGPTAPKDGATPQIAINGNETNNGPGLPISGFFNKDKSNVANGVDIRALKSGQTLTPEQMRNMMPIVQLERAVAKLRFAFAKPQGMDGVQVTRIVIDSGVIPVKTNIFPRESNTTDFALPASVTYSADSTYIPAPAGTSPLLASDAIRSVADPEALTRSRNSDKSAEQYDQLLTTNTTSHYVYLRETDKAISGKIYYRLPGDTFDRSEAFTMPLSETTNFHRNHYWTVYAYFKGNGLYIKPVVLPWIDGSNYTYTQRGSAVVAISDNKQTLFGYGWTTSHENSWWQDHQADSTEWYFRRQDPEYTSNWNYDWLHSQMVSAAGLNAGGVPIYANRIELRTSGFNIPLRLRLSNPDHFFIVTYNVSNGEYRSTTDALGAEIPLTIAQGGTTYFYVLPKGDDDAGQITEAYLVTDPTDGTASQKLPFNSGVFPGSNENTEINFYSVSVTDFKNYYNRDQRPDNIRIYDSSHWLQTL